MQQEVLDLLTRVRVPTMMTGGWMLGEAIEIACEELKVHSLIQLSDIESEIADQHRVGVKTVDQNLRRALSIAEFRSGRYPNVALMDLMDHYGFAAVTPKKFVYAAAREVIEREESC